MVVVPAVLQVINGHASSVPTRLAPGIISINTYWRRTCRTQVALRGDIIGWCGKRHGFRFWSSKHDAGKCLQLLAYCPDIMPLRNTQAIDVIQVVDWLARIGFTASLDLIQPLFRDIADSVPLEPLKLL